MYVLLGLILVFVNIFVLVKLFGWLGAILGLVIIFILAMLFGELVRRLSGDY